MTFLPEPHVIIIASVIMAMMMLVVVVARRRRRSLVEPVRRDDPATTLPTETSPVRERTTAETTLDMPSLGVASDGRTVEVPQAVELADLLQVRQCVPLHARLSACAHCDAPLRTDGPRTWACTGCGAVWRVRSLPFLGGRRGLVEEGVFRRHRSLWTFAHWYGEAAYLERQELSRWLFQRVLHGEGLGADAVWAWATELAERSRARGHWAIYRNVRLRLSEILRADGRRQAGMQLLAEVLFLDVNGPGYASERTPAFDAELLGEVHAEPCQRFFDDGARLGFDAAQLAAFFINRALGIYDRTLHRIDPQAAWAEILSARSRLPRPLPSLLDDEDTDLLPPHRGRGPVVS
jgi:hypothetical protein